MFRRAPSRVGRGRRAAVDFVVCFGFGGFLLFFFFRFSKARPFFAFKQKSLFIPGCVQGAIILLLGLCACQCMCNIRRFY